MTGTTVPNRPEETSEKRPLWLLLVLACAVFAGGLVVAFVVLNGSDDDETAELDPALVFQLQNLCFENDPPLFYDDQGYCYMVDPSTLSGDELIAQRVVPGPVSPAEAEAMAEPVAPGESATPADGSTDTTTSATSAPTTTSTAATSTPSTTSTSSTTTSTTTPTAINIEASGWVWSLTVGQVDGAQCVADGDGVFPPGCLDQLEGPYNVFFGVSNGGVSGTQMVALLENSVTFDGFISLSGAASLNIDMENLGRMSHGGTLTGNCLITGDYQYSDGRNISGTFSLTSTGPGC